MISKVLEKIKYPFKLKSNKKFYRQFVGPNKLFFDIGANVGFKTKVFRDLSVTVVAVEPQESCLKILHKKFDDDKKVSIVNKGISNRPGELKIKISSSSSYISTFSDKWQSDGRFSDFNYDKEQSVEVITFDQLVQDFGMPDFVKIDVEGYEYEVISGLTKKIPCLSFEFTSEFISDAVKICDHLESIGFSKYNYGDGESMKLALDKWLNKNDFINYMREKIENNNNLWGDIYAR